MNKENCDKMEEECGVLGIYSDTLRNDIVSFAYYGLHALQHRGQESAGITICDSISENRARHKTIKNMGLVSEVLTGENLTSYAGNVLIGHIRYSTTGISEVENCHPLRGESAMGKISLAHNGNLINKDDVRQDLIDRGAIFQTGMDTENLIHLVLN